MINSKTDEYYRIYYGTTANPYLSNYISDKNKQDKKLNYIIISFIVLLLLSLAFISNPIYAKSTPQNSTHTAENEPVYLQKNFEENIKNKYPGSYITFPAKGAAHIKKNVYINSKPIKINIVELNTNVNPNLKIKPQIASRTLSSKTTVKRIAQKEGAVIAINGGFFKPQTGVPLGALMIDGNILTGPIYNRVGIAIFEQDNKTTFKMANINFDIKAYTRDYSTVIDNINQPRMLSTHTLIYTPIWGELSPPPPQNGYNMVIEGNRITKISANAVKIPANGVVVQGNKDIISKLGKNKEIYIDIKLQDELKNAKHIIGAGPYLVKDSQVYTDYKTQKLQAISGKNPRSAVGYKNDGTFIIVTVDGREKTSVGMTLEELANLMKKIGCEYAMNFDGGSSSALYVDGKIVNSAVNKEGIAVSNALVVNEFESSALQLSSL